VGIWKFGTDDLVNVSGLYLVLQPNREHEETHAFAT
jgi:hypothetical protein